MAKVIDTTQLLAIRKLLETRDPEERVQGLLSWVLFHGLDSGLDRFEVATLLRVLACSLTLEGQRFFDEVHALITGELERKRRQRQDAP